MEYRIRTEQVAEKQAQIKVTLAKREQEAVAFLVSKNWRRSEADVVIECLRRVLPEIMMECIEMSEAIDGSAENSENPHSRTRIDVLDLQMLANQLGIPSDRLLKAIKDIKLEVINGVHSD